MFTLAARIALARTLWSHAILAAVGLGCLGNLATAQTAPVGRQALRKASPLWRFTKIADSGTAVPGIGGSFGLLDAPSSVTGSQVFFRGGTGSYYYGFTGVYRSNGGSILPMVDITTQSEDASHNLEWFGGGFGGWPCGTGGSVAFHAGSNTGVSHVYRWDSQSLSVQMSTTDSVPGSPGTTFGGILGVTASEGQLTAFTSFDVPGRVYDGVYANLGSGIFVVADRTTAEPGGLGTFATFANNGGSTSLQVSSGSIVFWGQAAGHLPGLYRWSTGGLSVVMNESSSLPAPPPFNAYGGTWAFDSDGPNTVFTTAWGAPYNACGVWIAGSAGVTPVYVPGTPIPGGCCAANYAEGPAIDNGKIAVTLSNGAGTWLLSDLKGTLESVLSYSEMLDGKIVNNIILRSGGMGSGRIGFYVDFTDGTKAIYVAY